MSSQPVGFVPVAQVKAYLVKVKQRSKLVFGDGEYAASIQARADSINTGLDRDAINEKLNMALNAPTFEQCLLLVREVFEMFSVAAQGKTACHKGCNACCHIPVAITSQEARIIGRAIGRPLSTVPKARALSLRDLITVPGSKERNIEVTKRVHNGTPCVFLKSGQCSIYENRPIACRQQFNVDYDDLLCRLIKGHSVLVPYLNLQQVESVLASYAASHIERHAHDVIADIRDWFK